MQRYSRRVYIGKVYTFTSTSKSKRVVWCLKLSHITEIETDIVFKSFPIWIETNANSLCPVMPVFFSHNYKHLIISSADIRTPLNSKCCHLLPVLFFLTTRNGVLLKNTLVIPRNITVSQRTWQLHHIISWLRRYELDPSPVYTVIMSLAVVPFCCWHSCCGPDKWHRVKYHLQMIICFTYSHCQAQRLRASRTDDDPFTMRELWPSFELFLNNEILLDEAGMLNEEDKFHLLCSTRIRAAWASFSSVMGFLVGNERWRNYICRRILLTEKTLDPQVPPALLTFPPSLHLAALLFRARFPRQC